MNFVLQSITGSAVNKILSINKLKFPQLFMTKQKVHLLVLPGEFCDTSTLSNNAHLYIPIL